jgi:CDGSH iron-sulfur domain-containing protein 3
MSEPVVASRMPYVVEVEKGKSYWWCACGRSRSQPYCDGSHQGTGLTPVQFTATGNEKIWLCGCKHSKRVPLCDGSHNKLP